MVKIIFSFFIFIFFFILVSPVQAESNSFVSVVNPVRGNDFWQEKDSPEFVVKNQIDILKKVAVPATWLVRFDALKSNNLVNLIKNTDDEKGLFLEITPTLTKQALVKYNETATWHSAGSVFLTGYSQPDRIKLVDVSFEEFRKVFGYYPKSIGAWWIDSYSLEYMQKKYGVVAALIVADQYSTDNYQIWGQFWGTPYYPAKKNALIPAQNIESKIPIVITQWATRDPVNGYGKGVEESTYSVQANDYIDYHNLDQNYFSKLIDIYTSQKLNKVNHLVVGLENSYSWQKYGEEYKNQINILKQKATAGQFKLLPVGEFGQWYKLKFSQISPSQVIVSDDPLGTDQKAVWFMNSYYRVGWFFNKEGSVVRDIRQYIDGSEEICFREACNNLNFATFATRVLDDVTKHQKWILDQGKISDLKVIKNGENVLLTYKNSADLERKLEFLPRDISWEGEPSTVDGLILEITSKQPISLESNSQQFVSDFNFSLINLFNILLQIFKYLIFLVLVIFIPGLVIYYKFENFDEIFVKEIFFSLVFGLVGFTVFSFIFGLANLNFLIFGYILILIYFYIKQKLFNKKILLNFLSNKLVSLLIFFGVIFQYLPVFKSGLIYKFGLGLWGPNTHDGIWHLALIEQLTKSIPPENPIFGGTKLENYHYFFDLLVAQTHKLTFIPVADLLFRIYPLIFSILLGLGVYLLSMKLFRSKLSTLITLYLVYFAGSFGFVVSILKHQEWGGESAFWANQAISFNLNPPFAISVVILTAILLLLSNYFESNFKYRFFVLIVLMGSLISFKAYASILLGFTLLLLSLINLRKKDYRFLALLFGMGITTLLTLFPQYKNMGIFTGNSSLFIFSPFWFVHSMIDNPDRVGWLKLSSAREAYFQRKEWFKFVTVELLSLIIFIFGNLGLRLIGIFGIFNKNIVDKNLHKFVIIISIFSLLIPILFIQSGTPWNTIQFFYYGMYFSCFYAGFVLSILLKKLPVFLGVMLLLVVLIVSPISSITTAKGYIYPYPHAYISKFEVEGLEFLSKLDRGIVLTYPYSKSFKEGMSEPLPLFAYDTTAYVSAISKQSVFIEDEVQNQILETDYIKRLLISKEIFNQKKNFARSNLEKNKIKYIYILKNFNKNLNEEELGIKKIFENPEVLIYSVN